MTDGISTAEGVTGRLMALADAEQRERYRRYFRLGEGEYGDGDMFIGVPMRSVFDLARAAIDLPVAEIERLLDSPVHEVRAAACSVMDKRARRRRTSDADLGALYGLYRRRIDRINNWDLVDLAAPYVVGRYLHGRPFDTYEELARSANVWERRTAMYATSYDIRQASHDATLFVAGILAADPHDLVQKSVGAWLREVGRKDRSALDVFLKRHATTMARTALRTAIEHHPPSERAAWLAKSG